MLPPFACSGFFISKKTNLQSQNENLTTEIGMLIFIAPSTIAVYH